MKTMTGKTCCAVVAAGPGTTDPITDVANAWYEASAMDAAKAGVEP
jgi:thiamine pyrophosphate-dependent acetolactate synthase large subunit-like protein